MSKDGIAPLCLFYKIDRSTKRLTTGRIPSFDIRYSFLYLLLGAAVYPRPQLVRVDGGGSGALFGGGRDFDRTL
jgi:hypothetical protein